MTSLRAAGQPPATLQPPSGQPPAVAPTVVAGSALLNAARAGGEALPRHVMQYGNSGVLLRNNKELRPWLLDDARNVQRVANIAEYNWDPDGLGAEFADAVRERVRAGKLEVNATIDAFGSYQHVPFSRHRRFVKQLRRDGFNVRTNWKLPFLRQAHDPRWDHRKLFNFDGKIAYVGGMGLGRKYDQYSDFMYRFTGPSVAQAQAEFLGRFVDLGGDVSKVQEHVFAESLASPAKSAGTGVRLLSNRRRERAITANLEQAIAQAKAGQLKDNRLWLMSPWLTTRAAVQPLLDAKAANPDLDVRLAIPGREAKFNRSLVRLSRTYYEELIRAGVDVYEQPMKAHAKVMLAGDKVMVGSMNLSHGSMFNDHELSVAIDDAATATTMKNHFERDFAHARKLDLSDLRGPTTQIYKGLRHLTRFRF